MADADAHVEAAVADFVEIRGRLRKVERQAVVDRHDRRAELDRLRSVGNREAKAHAVAETRAVHPLETRGLELLGDLDGPFPAPRGGGEGNGWHLHATTPNMRVGAPNSSRA